MPKQSMGKPRTPKAPGISGSEIHIQRRDRFCFTKARSWATLSSTGIHPPAGSTGEGASEAGPMRFTLKQLEYFVAAGDRGSITIAAEQVNISQPSISAAI